MQTTESKMGDPVYASNDSPPKTISDPGRNTTSTSDGGRPGGNAGSYNRPGGSAGAYNPSTSFQGMTATKGSYAGTFVSEATHFDSINGHTPVNYGAQAYNLSSIPRSADPAVFQMYAPSGWLKNSAPQQLEQLNAEMLHYGDSEFESMFVVNAPTYMDVVANDPRWYKQFDEAQSNPNSSSGVHIPDQTVSGHGGGLDMGKVNVGLMDAKLGYTAVKNMYTVLGGEETAAAFGETIVEGAVGLAEGVGIEAGTVGLAAEMIGGTVAIGATAATLGMVGAGLLLGYGAYEAAVGLGAPTISDDIKALGGATKDVTNFFNGFL